jgi:hypothetical protein
MATPNTEITYSFGNFLVLLGNGADPEDFVAPCGVKSRSFDRSTNFNDTPVEDCDDPDAVDWMERDPVSQSASLPMAGNAADQSFDIWDAWYQSHAAKNVRVEMGARVWEGQAKIQDLKIQGEKGQRVKFTATLISHGPFLRVNP